MSVAIQLSGLNLIKSFISTYFNKDRVRIHDGYFISRNGVISSSRFQKTEMARAMTVPVDWDGSSGTLHFWNYVSKKVPVNEVASRLFDRPGFRIRGRAIVTTSSSMWYHARVQGTEAEARANLEHLGYDDDQVIYRPGGRWGGLVDLYTRDKDIFLVLKLAL